MQARKNLKIHDTLDKGILTLLIFSGSFGFATVRVFSIAMWPCRSHNQWTGGLQLETQLS